MAKWKIPFILQKKLRWCSMIVYKTPYPIYYATAVTGAHSSASMMTYRRIPFLQVKRNKISKKEKERKTKKALDQLSHGSLYSLLVTDHNSSLFPPPSPTMSP